MSLYRGVSYELPEAPQFNKQIYKRDEITSSPETGVSTIVPSETSSHSNVHEPQQKRAETSTEGEQCSEQLTEVQVNYEDEVDKLLDSLGPRYTDWPGLDPLPVDADMLPGVVPDYEPPFRILPYGVRSSLGIKEATALRRLARRLPPHFALGMFLIVYVDKFLVMSAEGVCDTFRAYRQKQAASRFSRCDGKIVGTKFNCKNCPETRCAADY